MYDDAVNCDIDVHAPPPARRLFAILTLLATAVLAYGGSFHLPLDANGHESPNGGYAYGNYIAGQGYQQSGPYATGTDGWYGRSAGGPSSKCEGAVTYNWTWSGTDQAPAQVVLKVESSAYWGGAPGGSCSAGIDGAVYTPSYPYPGAPAYSATSVGVKYLVKAVQAGGHVDYTISPSASDNGGGVGVQVRVTLTPVMLTLGGTRQSTAGGDECMIGKGITGTLSADYTLDQWQWSIGGSIFKTYVASRTQGKLYPLVASDYATEHPHWFWKEGSSAIVSCTARIAFPDGTTAQVSGQRGADIYSPYAAFEANLLSNLWYMDTTGEGGSGRIADSWNPDLFSFEEGFCIDFHGEVGTPRRFWENGDAGKHCYAQLAYIYDYVIAAFGIPIVTATNGWVLDNDFPYPGTVNGDSNREFPASSTE